MSILSPWEPIDGSYPPDKYENLLLTWEEFRALCRSLDPRWRDGVITPEKVKEFMYKHDLQVMTSGRAHWVIKDTDGGLCWWAG